MTLTQAINIVIARTGHDRYRYLCSEANPDAGQREAYRRLVMELAGAPAPVGPPRPAPAPPRLPAAPPRGCCGG